MSEETSTLSASEQAHIDSGGESAIVEDTTAPVENRATEQVQPDETAFVEEKVQKVVPLAALHEERAKAKEMREKVRVLEEQTRIGNERLQQLYQHVQQRNAVPVPTLEENPIEHFKHKTETLEKQLEEQQQFRQQYQQQEHAKQQYQSLARHVATQVQEYAKETPDIQDAIDHVFKADVQALMAIGQDQASAVANVTRHHDELVVNLANQGVNIPERMHALAKARGYQAKAPTQDGQQKLQAVQKGTAAAKSLGSGGAVVNGLSLQALANMSHEEFAEATSGKNDAAWRKLMGG